MRDVLRRHDRPGKHGPLLEKKRLGRLTSRRFLRGFLDVWDDRLADTHTERRRRERERERNEEKGREKDNLRLSDGWAQRVICLVLHYYVFRYVYRVPRRARGRGLSSGNVQRGAKCSASRFRAHVSSRYDRENRRRVFSSRSAIIARCEARNPRQIRDRFSPTPTFQYPNVRRVRERLRYASETSKINPKSAGSSRCALVYVHSRLYSRSRMAEPADSSISVSLFHGCEIAHDRSGTPRMRARENVRPDTCTFTYTLGAHAHTHIHTR